MANVALYRALHRTCDVHGADLPCESCRRYALRPMSRTHPLVAILAALVGVTILCVSLV